MSSLLNATKQQRSRAQRQSVSPKIDQAFLIAADPIGKQAHLHMVDDRIPKEVVPPAIGDVGLLGLGFPLFGGAQEIVGGELNPPGESGDSTLIETMLPHRYSNRYRRFAPISRVAYLRSIHTGAGC